MAKFLLDTHILIWHLQNDEKLSAYVSNIIQDANNSVYVSMVSLWEMAIKIKLNKLTLLCELEEFVPSEFIILQIEQKHIFNLKNLPLIHNDPFDRLLVSQSFSENIPLITSDTFIKQYNIQTL
jgi:PIN domain nuclease of toxin-antitoxin system